MSSSDEDITSNITLAKLPAVPKPPSSGTSDIDQKKLASGTEQFSKKSRSSAKKPVSYDYEGNISLKLFCKKNLFYTNY